MDRPGSNVFIAQLTNMLKAKTSNKKVCPTAAAKGEGIEELMKTIDA
jgi:selenocysteine-specific translation elongation factor